MSGKAARPIDEGAYPTFATFVDAHRDEIEQLVATHTTQTNEVGRTLVMLPALGLVSSEADGPLALLDIGASAGLNLLIDRYGFHIGAVASGSLTSPVRLECAVEGELRPPVPERVHIAWRLGLDLHPLDVREPETRAWLLALVWPEHVDRMARLDAALDLARDDPPTVLPGDLTRDLARVAARAPTHATLVVSSTWTLAYVVPELRRSFVADLQEVARSRGDDVWLVAGEGQGVLASLGLSLVDPPSDGTGGPSLLALCRFGADGAIDARLLAECHAHGRWLRWLDRPSAVDAGGAA